VPSSRGIPQGSPLTPRWRISISSAFFWRGATTGTEINSMLMSSTMRMISKTGLSDQRRDSSWLSSIVSDAFDSQVGGATFSTYSVDKGNYALGANHT
jgi:hypothetical protein